MSEKRAIGASIALLALLGSATVWLFWQPPTPVHALATLCVLYLCFFLGWDLAAGSGYSPGNVLGPIAYVLIRLVLAIVKRIKRFWRKAHGFAPWPFFIGFWALTVLAAMALVNAVNAFIALVALLSGVWWGLLAIPRSGIPTPIAQQVKARALTCISDILKIWPDRGHEDKLFTVLVGKTINGYAAKLLWIDLSWKWHWLIAGTTQSGKSTFIRSMLGQLVQKAKLTANGTILCADLKKDRADGPYLFKAVLDRYTDDLGEAVEMLEYGVQEIQNRYANQTTLRAPLLLIIIDEVPNLTLAAKWKTRALEALSIIARTGAGANVRLIVTVQHLKADTLPRDITTNLTGHILFRPADASAARQVCPDFPEEYVPTLVTLQPGECYVQYPGMVKPVKVQGLMVEKAEAAGIVQGAIARMGDNDLTIRVLQEFIREKQGIGRMTEAIYPGYANLASEEKRGKKAGIQTIYEQLASWGIIESKGERFPYKLIVEPGEAIAIARRQIKGG